MFVVMFLNYAPIEFNGEIFFLVALRPSAGYGLLIHTQRRTTPVGLLSMSDQFVAETST